MENEKEYSQKDIYDLLLEFDRKEIYESETSSLKDVMKSKNLMMLDILDSIAKQEGKRAIFVNHWKRNNRFFLFVNDIDDIKRKYNDDLSFIEDKYMCIECSIGETPFELDTEIMMFYVNTT